MSTLAQYAAGPLPRTADGAIDVARLEQIDELLDPRIRFAPPKPAEQRIALTSGPNLQLFRQRHRDRLARFLLHANYSSVYRDLIVRAVTTADDPADTMIELVAQGYLELEDLHAAQAAYGVD